MKIKNYEEIVEKLTEMLMGFDIEKCEYQRDVYAYINDGIVLLEVYDNFSGNSYIADNHIKVYTDKPHFDNIYDFYDENGIDTICEALNVEAYDFTEEVADYVNCDFVDVDMNDIERYVDDNPDLFMLLYTYYEQFIHEHYAEYEETARYYIDKLDDFLEWIEEE